MFKCYFWDSFFIIIETGLNVLTARWCLLWIGWVQLLPPPLCTREALTVRAKTTSGRNPPNCLAFSACVSKMCGLWGHGEMHVCLDSTCAAGSEVAQLLCNSLWQTDWVLTSVLCPPPPQPPPAGWTGSNCSALRRFSTPPPPGSSLKRESSEWCHSLLNSEVCQRAPICSTATRLKKMVLETGIKYKKKNLFIVLIAVCRTQVCNEVRDLSRRQEWQWWIPSDVSSGGGRWDKMYKM